MPLLSFHWLSPLCVRPFYLIASHHYNHMVQRPQLPFTFITEAFLYFPQQSLRNVHIWEHLFFCPQCNDCLLFNLPIFPISSPLLSGNHGVGHLPLLQLIDGWTATWPENWNWCHPQKYWMLDQPAAIGGETKVEERQKRKSRTNSSLSEVVSHLHQRSHLKIPILNCQLKPSPTSV